jgi:hypothetical protein
MKERSMPRCAGEDCGRWRPDVLVRRGAGANIDGRWFCSRECIEQMARQLLADVRPAMAVIPTVPPARLGAILRHHGVCKPADIERALEAQRQSRLRLGEQLLAMGLTERQPLLRALAAQAGVSYLANVDAAMVRKAPGNLSSDAVRALGLVPIDEAIGGRIRVACPAPLPRRALGCFRRLTGWTPEVLLVSDPDWRALLANYGADVQDGAAAERRVAGFVMAETLTDAVAGIADAATRARNTLVIEARWEPYTWVRVQGGGAATDVVFAHSLSLEEEPCQAATTSH